MAAPGGVLGLTSYIQDPTLPRQGMVPPQPQPAPTPQPTGTGNLVTSALGSGFYGAGAELGGAVQAGATLLGAPNVAQSAADFAARQRETAATYATPENENASVFSPRGLAYRVLQGAPVALGALGAGVVGGMVAPEAAAGAGAAGLLAGAGTLPGLAAAGAFSLPFSVGSNVDNYETATDKNGNPIHGALTPGAAAKAIALGVPEAAIGAAPLHLLGGGLARQAAAQAAAGAAQDFIGQQMGDPNRGMVSRMQEMVSSAVTGGVTGALMGAGVHAFAKMPPADLGKPGVDAAVAKGVDQVLGVEQPSAEVPPQPEQVPPQPEQIQAEPEDTRQVFTPSARRADWEATQSAQDAAAAEAQRVKEYWEGQAYPPGQPPALATPAELPEAAGTVREVQPPEAPPTPPPAEAPAIDPAVEAAVRAKWEETGPTKENRALAEQAGMLDENGALKPAEAAPPPPGQPAARDIGIQPMAEEQKKEFGYNAGDNVYSIRQNGSDVGVAHIEFEGHTAVVKDIYAYDTLDSSNRFGSSAVRQMLSQIRTEHPEITNIQGERVSGARRGGSHGLEGTGVNVDVSLPPRPEPNRPPIDAVEPKYQPLYQKLEDLHAQVSDPADTKALEDAQTGLALRKTGDVQQAKITADKISAAVAGDKARADLAPALKVDTSKVADIGGIKAGEWSVPLPDGSTVRIKGSKDGSNLDVSLVDMLGKDGKLLDAPNQVGTAPMRQVMRALTKEYPDLETIGGQRVSGAREAAGAAERQATAKVAPPKNVADLQKTVIAAKKSLNGLMDMKPPDHANEAWQNLLDDQDARLQQVASSLKKGGNPADLTGLPADHFTGPALQDTLDKLPPEMQKAYAAHADKEEDVMGAIRRATGQGFWGRDAGPPSTAGDARVTQVLDNGGSAKDVFADMARNGSTGEVKTLANIMARKGVDAPVQFSPRDENRFPGVNNDTFGPAYAKYDPTGNRIHLFQPANLEQAMLHEGAHAATSRALEANTPAATEMKQLYAQTKELSPDKGAYGLNDVHEFVAEAFSNPQFRSTLAGITAPAEKVSLWQKFKNAVGGIFGVQGTAKNMLDRVMETGGRVMDENQNAPGAASPGFFGRDTSRPEGANEATKDYVAAAAQVGEKVRAAGAGIKPAIQKAALGLRSPQEIAAGVAERVPSATRFTEAVASEGNQKNAWNKSRSIAHNAYAALSDDEKAQHDNVAAATVLGIDARKPPREQNPDLAKASNAADIMRVAAAAHGDWGRMSPEAKAAYNMRVDTNQTSQLAGFTIALDKFIKGQYPKLTEGFENNPASDYQVAAEVHDTPAVAKKFWLDQMAQREAGLTKQLNADKIANGGETPEKSEALERWAKGIEARRAALDDVPYFRVGHGNGDYYVAGKIALDKAGLPDQGAIDKLSARLEKAGFGDQVLQRGNDNNSVYLKVASREQAQRLDDVFRALQTEGALSQDHAISSGLSEQAAQHGVAPAVMQDIIASLKSARPELPEGMDPGHVKAFEDAWDQNIRDTTRDMMDLLSDSSPLKINARRKDVQGYAKQMGDSARQADPGVSAMLARFGTAQEKGEAVSGIRNEIKALKSSDASIADKEMAQNSASELLSREARRPTTPPNGLVSAATKISRASEIGFNPAYFLTMHTQDWTMGWGELGKSHGMLASARELAKAEIPSINIMRAMLGDHDWASAGMRLSTLVKGGVSERDATFLTHLDNLGFMTHGGFTQAVAPSEGGEGLRAKFGDMSTAMGRYAEVQPRIKMALAARALWRGAGKDGDLYSFVGKKIRGSQFDYSSENAPRQLTRAGALGDFSPLVNQFMSYRIKATEKLYREFHDMFAGETAESRAQAGKFLAAHLAAVTVISGALGLPMAAVGASVYDKIADDLTGSPNHDIMASFRVHLANVFGKTAGEAIAKGLPRLAGLDLSRLGDQKIAPGSDTLMMLTEKRKFEDAEKDWLKDMAGSAIGMGAKFALGMRDLSNGDYMQAAQKMVPEAFRGPTESLELLARGGYRDKSGQLLPITAGAREVLLTALGLDPEAEAQYQDKKTALVGLQTRAQIQSQNITQHLALALTRGDMHNFQQWVGQSQAFQQAHPGQMPPVADLRRYMMQHAKSAAFAGATGTPVGIKPRDIAGRGMVAF